MMKTVALIALMTVPALAEDWACDLTREAETQLFAHEANYVNRAVTRTPEGGPYQVRIVGACQHGLCDVQRSESAPLMKYEPNHPDANEDGFVAYPNMSVDQERDGIQAAFAELDIAAKIGGCGAERYETTPRNRLYVYRDPRHSIASIAIRLDRDGLVCSTTAVDWKGVRTDAFLTPHAKCP